MRLAKENNVTVLLDGQGGDEGFAGYQYFHGFFFTELLRSHRFAKLFLELYKSFVRRQEKEAFQTFAFQLLPSAYRKHLLHSTLPHINRDFFYQHIDMSVIFNEFFTAEDLNTSIVRHYQYKLEHLLRPEDRNSMAFSIEARVPYLDYRLIEYLLSVPSSFKITKGENKLLQKRAVGKYSIPEIVNRRDKVGFGTPGQAWMKDDKWRKFTTENYNYVCNKLPHIFNKKATLKDNLFDRWKINQIATWLETLHD